MGDNGILRQAQYASFMSEMAAVEEAVQLWGADHYDDENHSIPAKGVLPESEISNSERLGGEIGYYRTWSRTNTMPATSVTTEASGFNSLYSAELVPYPGGIEDLFYLDNDGLNLTSNKKYVIDAENSMVYSVQGISLNGVRCYSLAMAKAVMNGTYDAPAFASAEVSGSQSMGGKRAAGNTEPQYIEDEEGNLVENPNYNPYGFQIITDTGNSNIYKLYNNGDLYGKGVKSKYLNTSEIDMDKIDSSVWRSLKIPSEVGTYKKVIPGIGCIYIIDSNDYLWALGDNSSNKFGLSQEQQIEYTGREVIKLDIDGKKVYNVLACASNTYVVTLTNGVYELYGAGYNAYGNLGIGNKDYVDKFTKCVGIEHPENLISVESSSNTTVSNLFVVKDETNTDNIKIYFSGYDNYSNFGISSNYYLNITRVYDGNIGNDIDQDIKQIKWVKRNIVILKKDGKLLVPTSNRDFPITADSGTYKEPKPATWGFNDTDTYTVESIYGGYQYFMNVFELKRNNQKEYFIFSYDNNYLGLAGSTNNVIYNFTNDIPAELKNEGIKNIYVAGTSIYLLGVSSGKLWASGGYDGLGLGSEVISNPIGFVCLQDATKDFEYSLPTIKGMYYYDDYSAMLPLTTPFFLGTDDNIYITGNRNLMFGNDILEKNWTKIASNVKKFNAYSTNAMGYIDKNDDLWIVGDYSTRLGIDETNDRQINNFTLLKELVDSSSKTILDGNVKDFKTASGASYLLTLDNKLYVSGITLTPTWVGNFNIGISATNADGTTNPGAKKFYKLLDNVEYFEANRLGRYAVVKEDDVYKLYGWGRNDGNVVGTWGTETPTDITSLAPFNVGDIIKIICGQRMTHFLTKDGNLYVVGTNQLNGYGINGINYATSAITAFDMSKFNSEKIIDIVYCHYSSSATIVLTQEGNLYGFGYKNKLGIGSDSNDFVLEPIKISGIDNVFEIAGGDGFFACVKNDGSVWGTGSNTYGILGRWIGIDRNSPNSRYKTAFNWVECPELEI